jgi:hypothetical protein
MAPLLAVVLGAAEAQSLGLACGEAADIDRNTLFAGVADPVLPVL